MALKKINYNGSSKVILRLCEMVNQLIDGGGGSTVTYTQTLQSGTKTGSISIDGVSTDMYAPTQPTKLSDLQNDTNFIDNTVNNLVNYYKKTETYTQAEVDALISAIVTLNILVVQSLPTQDISTTTIYLVPKQTPETQDIYDEYIYVNNAWEHIGTTQIDLSNYYTKTQTDNLLADKVDKVAGKQLSTEDFTSALKTKLDGIASGAEVNVQSDWSQSDNTADDFIKNKPTNVSDFNNDSGFITGVDVEDIGDVDLNNLANGQVLKYNSTTQKWENQNESGGGSSYTEGDGIDISAQNVISVDTTFSEASTRANIASGETFATILGKIKKYFTDLKDLAFIAKDGTSSTKYLRGDGTWQTPPNDNTWTAMVGATSSANGSVGYVNAVPPKDGYNTKYLRADGTWAVPPNDNSNVTQTATSTNANYEVLFSATADNTTRTETARKDTGLTFNPSTDTLSTKYINHKVLKALTGSGTAGATSDTTPKFTPALWTFNSGVTVANGEVYLIKIPVAGGSYGVWLSLNNGTNYYPVAVSSGKVRFQTHYAKDTVIAVTYESAGVCTCYAKAGADATADVTGIFRVLNDYDANTTYTNMSASELTTGTATTARSISAKVLTDWLNGKLSTKVSDNPTFTEASTRANIASGESFATILGKIKKFFTDLKTVAFTGAYSDLSGLPTIPSAQVNSDWDASSGVAQILNKPTLATVATSGSYNDLSNKPTIPTDFVSKANGGTFNGNIVIDRANGTTSANGEGKIVLGNNKASGTAGNARGYVDIFGTSAYYARIRAGALTANRNLDLPNKAGTLALTSDIPSSLPANGGNADTVDGSHAWQMQTLNANGETHGSSYWVLICQYNLDSDGYFRMRAGDGSVGVKVDYAAKANIYNSLKILSLNINFSAGYYDYNFGKNVLIITMNAVATYGIGYNWGRINGYTTWRIVAFGSDHTLTGTYSTEIWYVEI